MAAGAEEPETSNAGIITDETTGQRVIPSSVRADGSVRKEIKVKPGYKPPEDVALYKSRGARAVRTRGPASIPGSEGLKDDSGPKVDSSRSNKNTKKRQTKQVAKVDDLDKSDKQKNESAVDKNAPNSTKPKQEPALSKEEEERLENEKKAKKLKKKLREAKELQSKKEKGETLLHEQFEKVIKINELIRDLEKLGFDKNGDEAEAPKD